MILLNIFWPGGSTSTTSSEIFTISLSNLLRFEKVHNNPRPVTRVHVRFVLLRIECWEAMASSYSSLLVTRDQTNVWYVGQHDNWFKRSCRRQESLVFRLNIVKKQTNHSPANWTPCEVILVWEWAEIPSKLKKYIIYYIKTKFTELQKLKKLGKQMQTTRGWNKEMYGKIILRISSISLTLVRRKKWWNYRGVCFDCVWN